MIDYISEDGAWRRELDQRPRGREDWQPDIDDNGNSIGRCPRCEGKARVEVDISALLAWWECEDCGHTSQREQQ
jgi:hypothetical protein